MKKREFLRKAGLLSASILVVPSLGYEGKSSDVKPVITKETESSVPMKPCYRKRSCGIPTERAIGQVNAIMELQCKRCWIIYP